jgi:hypothetical protein
VTPYLNPAQITSGTLSYALGLGKAIVSTPYAYAEELLSNDRGKLVGFGDCDAMAAAIGDLFCDDAARTALATRAYQWGRTMTWDRTTGLAVSRFCRNAAVRLSA